MTIDFDDFGVNHIISDMCQSHDCRGKLDELHYANPNFKVTLFTIPGEMTMELIRWCKANESWVELAMHGFYHTSNYECEKMTYEEFDQNMQTLYVPEYYAKGFKAPGWQISDDCYRWLKDNGWWVADQSYNTNRRPEELPAYVNADGNFFAYLPRSAPEQIAPVKTVEAWHGHTWDCVGNGIYETFEQVKKLVQEADNFQFVSEVLA